MHDRRAVWVGRHEALIYEVAKAPSSSFVGLAGLVVLALVLGTGLLLISSRKDGGPVTQPSAALLTATAGTMPYATPDDCPMHRDVCALAHEVDKPLRDFQHNRELEGGRTNAISIWDLRGIVAILRPVEIECTFSFGMMDDLCGGIRSSQVRLGIWMSNDPSGNERRGTTITELQATLMFWSPPPMEAGDEFGDPYLRVVAIGCPTSIADLSSCREHFSLVLTSRTKYPHDDAVRRWVMIVPVSWPPGGAPAARLAIPVAPTNEPVSSYAPFILGGAVSAHRLATQPRRDDQVCVVEHGAQVEHGAVPVPVAGVVEAQPGVEVQVFVIAVGDVWVHR